MLMEGPCVCPVHGDPVVTAGKPPLEAGRLPSSPACPSSPAGNRKSELGAEHQRATGCRAPAVRAVGGPQPPAEPGDSAGLPQAGCDPRDPEQDPAVRPLPLPAPDPTRDGQGLFCSKPVRLGPCAVSAAGRIARAEPGPRAAQGRPRDGESTWCPWGGPPPHSLAGLSEQVASSPSRSEGFLGV